MLPPIKKARQSKLSFLTPVSSASTAASANANPVSSASTAASANANPVSSASTAASTCVDTSSSWPNVYSAEMWEEKVKAYPWLICQDGKLGCSVCRSIGHMGGHQIRGPGVSKAWANSEVTFNGKERRQQLSSLRKKIKEHLESQAHKIRENIHDTSRSKTMDKAIDKLNAVELQHTEKVLRTAYYIAKNDRPYSDHPHLLQLQRLNGVDIGIGLRSRWTATQMIDHVAAEMKAKVCRQIQSQEAKLAILIDESTLIDKSVLIIYLNTEVGENVVEFFFLDLVELPNQDAKSILDSLLETLASYGFDEQYLKRNLLAFASDGASVMVGRKSGVATRMKQLFPEIVLWHCLNHRLELAVSDAIKNIQAINHFQAFVEKLYSIYSMSPKNVRALEECSLSLGKQMLKIGKIFSVRWVASSFRTVQAVWHSFDALHKHFKNQSGDVYKGLATKLASPEFLEDLALIYDTLFEIKELSEMLQKRATSLDKADKMIHRCILRLRVMKEKPGTKTLEAMVDVKEGVHMGVQLTSNKRHFQINRQQFLDSLIESMSSRMNSNENKLMAQIRLLNSDNWPTEIQPGFGHEEIRALAHRLHLPPALTANAFDDYVENIGRRAPGEIQKVINRLQVVPSSTAECERGFSAMNLISTDCRSSLTVSHLSSLMFVKIQGPPLGVWNSTDYARSWLRNHRSADDKRIRSAKETHQDTCESALWVFL